MTFGVTDEGFKKKTLTDVLSEIESDEKSTISPTLNTTATSVLGQINGIFADKLRELWDVALAVYSSQFPDSASGAALDSVASITGALRLPAATSTVTLSVNLDNATTLTVGQVVGVGATGANFVTTEEVTNSSGVQATLSVEAESQNLGPIVGNAGTINTIQSPVSGWSAASALTNVTDETYGLTSGQTLLISVDGAAAQTATFNSGPAFVDITNATAAEVAAVISTDITGITASAVGTKIRLLRDVQTAGNSIEVTGGTANPLLGFPTQKVIGFNPSLPPVVTGTATETFTLVDGETLTMRVDGGAVQTVTFNTADFPALGIGSALADEVAVVINTDVTEVLSFSENGKVRIEGKVEGTSGSIEITGGTARAKLGIPLGLVQGVSGDADLGRNLETDTEFRLRRDQLLRITGAGTVEAIRSDLLDLAGVTQAIVLENVTLLVDANGLPPKSFRAIVQGGTDEDIANQIWLSKPAGIETDGGVTESITDSQGFSHDIKFSRPTAVPLYIDLAVTTDPNTFPADGEDQIKAALISEANELLIGEDVISLRFKCAPFNVSGVLDVTTFFINITASPTVDVNIPIDVDKLATLDEANIIFV